MNPIIITILITIAVTIGNVLAQAAILAIMFATRKPMTRMYIRFILETMKDEQLHAEFDSDLETIFKS